MICKKCGCEGGSGEFCIKCGSKLIDPDFEKTSDFISAGKTEQKNALTKKTKVIILSIIVLVILAAAITGIVYYAEYNSESSKLDRAIENNQKVIDGLDRAISQQQRKIDDLEDAWSRYEYYRDRLK